MKSIDVFGRKIKIKLVSRMPEGYEYAAGLYCPEEGEILIIKGLHKRIHEETLYHEIFHAVMDRVGLRQARISSDVHEIMCEAFSRFAVEKLEFKKRSR